MLSIQEIHPILVHFPIVFFLTLGAFDVIALVRGVKIFGRSCASSISTGLAALAGVSAIFVSFFGDMAADVAVRSGVPEARLETHETLGTTTAIFVGIWALVRILLWWRDQALSSRGRTAAVGIEVAGALLVITTAYFGGQLVYDFGVNVAHLAA